MNRLVINKEKVEMISSAARRAQYDDDSRCYGIYKQSRIYDDALVLGINWSACGTKSPEETAAFAMHLTKASEMVSAINEIGATIKYSDKLLYSSKEEYECELESVCNMVTNYETEELIKWMLDGSEEK